MRSRSSVSVRRISPRPAGTPAPSPARRAAPAPPRRRPAARYGARGIAAEIARLDRKGAALAFDHRRVAEQLRDPRAVERRRHHEQLADPRAGPAARRAPARGRDRHRASARGIRRTAPRRCRRATGSSRIMRVKTPSVTTSMRVLARHLRAEAHAQADGVADLLAERRRHALGGGARGEPARLQHDDFLVRRPRLVAAAPAARAWSCRRRAARPARRRCARAAPRSAPAARRRSAAARRSRAFVSYHIGTPWDFTGAWVLATRSQRHWTEKVGSSPVAHLETSGRSAARVFAQEHSAVRSAHLGADADFHTVIQTAEAFVPMR